MPLPKLRQIKLPLLQFVTDGREYQLRDIVPQLQDYFSLTDEERNEVIPSGRTKRFHHLCSWVQHGLKSEGLLESTRRGYHRITAQGLEYFRQNSGSPLAPNGEGDGQTAEESIDENYQQIREKLAAELLEQIMDNSPTFFEELVIDLLVGMGYGGSREDAAKAVGRSGDGGIDGIINEDRLGLDVVYVQAKRWEANVSRPELQKFAGALQGQRARKGIFITTSDFSRDAREYVNNIDSKIVLIDGYQLAEYMIDHNVGVSVVKSYELKRVDLDYFIETDDSPRQDS